MREPASDRTGSLEFTEAVRAIDLQTNNPALPALQADLLPPYPHRGCSMIAGILRQAVERHIEPDRLQADRIQERLDRRRIALSLPAPKRGRRWVRVGMASRVTFGSTNG